MLRIFGWRPAGLAKYDLSLLRREAALPTYSTWPEASRMRYTPGFASVARRRSEKLGRLVCVVAIFPLSQPGTNMDESARRSLNPLSLEHGPVLGDVAHGFAESGPFVLSFRLVD